MRVEVSERGESCWRGLETKVEVLRPVKLQTTSDQFRGPQRASHAKMNSPFCCLPYATETRTCAALSLAPGQRLHETDYWTDSELSRMYRSPERSMSRSGAKPPHQRRKKTRPDSAVKATTRTNKRVLNSSTSTTALQDFSPPALVHGHWVSVPAFSGRTYRASNTLCECSACDREVLRGTDGAVSRRRTPLLFMADIRPRRPMLLGPPAFTATSSFLHALPADFLHVSTTRLLSQEVHYMRSSLNSFVLQ